MSRRMKSEIRAKDGGFVARCREMGVEVERSTYDETFQELKLGVERKLGSFSFQMDECPGLDMEGEKPAYLSGVEAILIRTPEGLKAEVFHEGVLLVSFDIPAGEGDIEEGTLKRLAANIPEAALGEKWAISMDSSPAARLKIGRVVIDPEICHGAPCIKGTRVMVSVILDCLAEGMSEREIMEQYPSLGQGDVKAAVEYAAAFEKRR